MVEPGGANVEAASAERGYVEADGARLEFSLWHGTRRPGSLITLLHEGLGCVVLWRDFPARLCAATGCSVLAYSRRGYGGSDPIALPRPPTYMHREGEIVLGEVLAQFDFERYLLVGHSDGASIAVIHAGAAPRPKLGALVLMAPHVLVEQVTLDGIAAAAAAYRHQGLRARLLGHHGERVDGAFWGWNQVWLSGGFERWNIEPYLPGIGVPVCLIQGESDPYGSAAQLDAIEAGVAVPVERHLLPGCGHSPFREAPEETLTLSASFLANDRAGVSNAYPGQ